jgi:hypothetical protein
LSIPPCILARPGSIFSNRNQHGKKNIQPGEGCNCEVMQDGSSPEDHQHVERTTPLKTKMKEFAVDQADRLGTELAPDIDKGREKRTTALRRAGDVRPL